MSVNVISINQYARVWLGFRSSYFMHHLFLLRFFQPIFRLFLQFWRFRSKFIDLEANDHNRCLHACQLVRVFWSEVHLPKRLKYISKTVSGQVPCRHRRIASQISVPPVVVHTFGVLWMWENLLHIICFSFNFVSTDFTPVSLRFFGSSSFCFKLHQLLSIDAHFTVVWTLRQPQLVIVYVLLIRFFSSFVLLGAWRKRLCLGLLVRLWRFVCLSIIGVTLLAFRIFTLWRLTLTLSENALALNSVFFANTIAYFLRRGAHCPSTDIVFGTPFLSMFSVWCSSLNMRIDSSALCIKFLFLGLSSAFKVFKLKMSGLSTRNKFFFWGLLFFLCVNRSRTYIAFVQESISRQLFSFMNASVGWEINV